MNRGLPVLEQGGGGGVNLAMLPIGIARTMILAIVTSRESEPGKTKWLTNSDQAKSFSWMIKQIIRNKTIKKTIETW